MEQEHKPRERSFIRDLVPDWRPNRGRTLWITRSAIFLVVILGVLTLIGLPFGVTLWAWVKLLIIPAVIAAAGLWFNLQQRERELRIADQRTQTDREIADQRRQDDALQTYLDQMGQLLLDRDRPLRQSAEGDEVRTLARARTLTVLSQLDGIRKGTLIRFLLEADLITGSLKGSPEERSYPIISLEDADLRGLFLFGFDLSGAVLIAADMRDADLSGCDLRDAWLSGAFLNDTELTTTDLSGTDLNGAVLSRASLYSADLISAKMEGADLSNVDLTEARVKQEQLDQAETLEGATMPNGQKYEEWLKVKEGRREASENSDP